ncbi:pyruvate, phosphate dikinase [Candidatus Pacearchaeota archaeon]|nr:pyruvate, phosphate dikinase [Candidatus Pacearchaeota archaeon]
MQKFVYDFTEGGKEMKETLGGKGANLAEMTFIDLPIPQGFTITTQACQAYYDNNSQLPKIVRDQVTEKLQELEALMGKKLGDAQDPLLVSVRSGAAVSMPGMMDTVLNLGLNDSSVEGLAQKTGNSRFAYDAYRRFIQMFGDVVMGVKHEFFEEILSSIKQERNAALDTDLTIDDLRLLISRYKQLIQQKVGKLFPNDPREQLDLAIDAVFGSWNNDRAISYRRLNNIAGLIGTAVNVQSMVFGNMGENSGTGVCFTRNPSTGENKFYGEYLMNAQGEDVVAGIRTPQPIDTLKNVMPENYDELVMIREKLEKHYRDMQDIEFTIENGRLYILQTRNGKRTAAAAVRIAVELVKEELLTEKQALLLIDPASLDQLLHKQLDPESKKVKQAVAKGLPASPGAAVGKVVFNAVDAFDQAQEGEIVILVRNETSPEDIEGMNAAQGILTSRGGMTSHAAVVARGMGKCCVAGCNELSINEAGKVMQVNGQLVREGDVISLDGSTGEVFIGPIGLIEPKLSRDFEKVMKWSDTFRKMKVRTNADTPNDAATAIKFGAQGIGLCRTEHMFFEESRIKAVREMILSDTKMGRERALAKILPMQRQDFKELFEIMDGRPVTIRLLDPPLHEFLPREEREMQELAMDMNVDLSAIKHKIEELHEFNPMLGHRGCRLAITYPEIAQMQARAIFEAAVQIISTGKSIVPEVMVPLVGNVGEFVHQKKIINNVAKQVMNENQVTFDYKVGTMIEVPRGAITADKIAKEAEFFSFGTNDLTQMSCGFSRDDSGTFLKEYAQLGIYQRDPFQALDIEGVGQIMQIAVDKAKPVRPNIKLGICGEHGGDPSSIEFCNSLGLNYVSCSPYRVPIARLAAAQAAIRQERILKEKSYDEAIRRSLAAMQIRYGSDLSLKNIEETLREEIHPDKLN